MIHSAEEMRACMHIRGRLDQKARGCWPILISKEPDGIVIRLSDLARLILLLYIYARICILEFGKTLLREDNLSQESKGSERRMRDRSSQPQDKR